MARFHLTVRVPQTVAERIGRLARDRSQSQTQVINELLSLGLSRIESEELDAGFALLGDPEMQDMEFPTGPQREAMRLAD